MSTTELPLVTIGISTYNRARSYFPRALESALAQTYDNLEIIVSDNGSTDGTAAVVRAHADPRLRYFRHEQNIGANENFNYCLEQARGTYFLLLHDDDLIDPDFVETCIAAAADAGEVGLIRTGTRVIDDDNRVLSEKRNVCQGMSPADLFLTWFGRETAFYLCSTLYNRRKLLAAGGFTSPRNLFQDVVALARLAATEERIDVAEVKASFRRHGANKGSGESALAWADDSLYLLDLLTRLMPDRAEELRSAGLPYLCRKCYRNVRSIKSPIARWFVYYAVSRRFGGVISPVRYSLYRFWKDSRRTASRVARSVRLEPSGATGRWGPT